MGQHSFKVDTRLPLLLSENYRSSEKALKELIDNAWDADADEVIIILPEPLTADPIVVEDDGTGMTLNELQNEYLNIARNRRARTGEFTPGKRRKVKGRKGIGKFAGLMAASTMKLETWARGKCSSFTLDKLLLLNHETLPDMLLSIDEVISGIKLQGTRITLSDLNQNIQFPDPSKLKQLLLTDYGREEDFRIVINGKPLGLDDLHGEYKEQLLKSDNLGEIKFRCSISNQKRKLGNPGISIRIDGKVIGEPSFFGLEKSEDIPRKLLQKCCGEIEITGCSDDVTADWGAIIEGSKTDRELTSLIQPMLREQLRSVYGQEMHLAQARLRKKAQDRISKLPENRREFADKAIKKILDKFYEEPEEKLEPIVNVLLDALERNDYRLVLEHINEARHHEVARFAEALEEFGLIEMVHVTEQATNRLKFLDYLEEICFKSETLEIHVHKAIEKNLWLFGAEYSLFSSNVTLKRQVEEFLGRKYLGDRADKRPDLFLSENLNKQRLLIEFKRPSHALKYDDYLQAISYRNDFHQNGIDQQIDVILMSGKLGNDLSIQERREPNVKIMTFADVISSARRQYQWLLSNVND